MKAQKTGKKEKMAGQNLLLSGLLSLTLGLAPFYPEPHLLGKLRWVAGGGVGMQLIDHFDLLLHGFPWLFFGYMLVRWIRLRTGL